MQLIDQFEDFYRLVFALKHIVLVFEKPKVGFYNSTKEWKNLFRLTFEHQYK